MPFLEMVQYADEGNSITPEDGVPNTNRSWTLTSNTTLESLRLESKSGGFAKMTTYPETPDAWIERNPYDQPSDPDAYEVCSVCDRIACECEGDDLQ